MSSSLPAVPTAARSMLEEMLAALKLRDEKPKDVPPSLPSRPTLKRRPPSTKNNKFKIENDAAEFSSEEPAGVTVVKVRPDLTEPSNGIILPYWPDEQESGSYEEAPDQKPHFVEEALVDNASRLEELEKLVISIKKELRQKEEENIALLEQVQEYQKNWSLCEEKIHSMEDLYQKQIQTLTMSLDVVQKSLLANDTAKQLACAGQKPDGTKNVLGRNVDCKSTTCPVYQLAKELEKQKQMFEDEARGLGDVKSGQTEYAKKSLEELRKLKAVYASWKKEYKKHLHETKQALLKLKKSEGEETHRRWWCQRGTAKGRLSLCSSS